MFKWFRNMMKAENEDDYETYNDYQEDGYDEYEEEEARPYLVDNKLANEQPVSGMSRKQHLSLSESNSIPCKASIVLAKPTSVVDAARIVEMVRQGQAVICLLDKTQPRNAERIIDYISGAAFGLSGRLSQMREDLFAVAPSSIEVSKMLSYSDDEQAIWASQRGIGTPPSEDDQNHNRTANIVRRANLRSM